jgi:GntP family gluconate:H+ symporter
MNPFLVLFLIALLLGLVSGMPLDKIVDTLKEGFGETMKKIGLVIILGTVLGVLLERSGATLRMANYILGKVGENRAPAALSITGFLVGLISSFEPSSEILASYTFSPSWKGARASMVPLA